MACVGGIDDGSSEGYSKERETETKAEIEEKVTAHFMSLENPPKTPMNSHPKSRRCLLAPQAGGGGRCE